ncbi:MAG: glycosyltransferase family 39 protein [Candidatus Aminicenantes bacterium]|nr:glycosyltransferase family 39 protein [Candidatus Aminicenantes bacterium]
MTLSLTVSESKYRAIPLFLLIIALLVHSAIILNLTPASGRPFQKYLSGAEKLVSGNLPSERISDFSPLYLQYHVLLNKVFRDPVLPALGSHILLISLSAMFLFMILRFFFPLLISLAGYLIFLFSPEILIYEKVMEPEPFQIFFITAMIYFLFRYYKGQKPLLNRNLVLSGIFLALTLLTRSNLFFLVILIPVWLYLFSKKGGGKHIGLRELSSFVIPSIAAILIIISMNIINTGSFSFYYQNPGYILFEGNNPNSTGQSAIYPPLVDDMAYEYKGEPDVHHQIYRDFARSVTGNDLSIKEVNSFWSKKALNFIVDHPFHFIENSILKLHYFFHDYRRHDVVEANEYDSKLKESWFPLFPFWILSAFALSGMIIGIKRIPEFFPLYIVILIQLGVLLAGYVSSRQRVSVIVVLIFFACLSLELVIKKPKLIPVLMFVIAAGVPSLLVRNDHMKEEDFLWKVYGRSAELWNEARSQRDKFNFETARELASISLTLTPWLEEEKRPAGINFGENGFSSYSLVYIEDPSKFTFSQKLNYAILLLNADKLDESEKILADLEKNGYGFKRDFDHSSQPSYYLGIIKMKRGDSEEALEFFKTALRKTPGSPFALSRLFALTGDELYLKKLERYFDRIDACYFLGRAFMDLKMYHSSVKYLSYVREKLPEYRKGNISYAVALAGSGDLINSYNIYTEVLKKRGEPVMFESETIRIFSSRVEKQPGNGVAHYYLGLIYEQYGLYREALKSLLESEKLMDQTEIIFKKIKELREKIRSDQNIRN